MVAVQGPIIMAHPSFIHSFITLRLTIYRQSVRLGHKPLETHDQYFFFKSTLAFIVFM
jgi:hypothetical protein